MSDLSVRRIQVSELDKLLDLYHHLNPDDQPLPDKSTVEEQWRSIIESSMVYCFVIEDNESLVASCTLVIVPNLTRGSRSYGVIENVVTREAFRKKGLGSKILKHALQYAWEQNCY